MERIMKFNKIIKLDEVKMEREEATYSQIKAVLKRLSPEQTLVVNKIDNHYKFSIEN